MLLGLLLLYVSNVTAAHYRIKLMELGQENRPESSSVPDGQTSRPRQLNKSRLQQLADENYVPPDGGWGWMCVLACFVTYFLIVGMSRSFGVIYSDVQRAFPGTKNIVLVMLPSMVITLTVGLETRVELASTCDECSMFAAMEAKDHAISHLISFFMREAAVFLLVGHKFLSYVTSYFKIDFENRNCNIANSYIFSHTPYISMIILIFIDDIVGIGAGLATNPGIIIVAKYFRKRRSQALGFSLAGTAIGSMIQPILLKYLSTTFGFRGALLIQGAMMLHVCAGALLYRDPTLIRPISQTTSIQVDSSQLAMMKSGQEKLTASSPSLRVVGQISKSRQLNKSQMQQLADENYVPPDGGWGWMCVLACFVTFFLIVGMSRSFGVIYNDVRGAFPGSKNIILVMIPSMVLALTVGLGFGAGLATNPGIVIVAKYFRKRRSRAFAISLAGTAIGSMIQPILLKYLSNTYGFRGALLIQGAMMLHVCAGALLYRDPTLIRRISQTTSIQVDPSKLAMVCNWA
uniref:Major facilitator superfamily (MFS) profile domain-containing protein n=1 Tax=Strigamia maritima TaxID=126957 RepID=T1IV11_STRMM